MTVFSPAAKDPPGLRSRSRLRSSPGRALCLALALEIVAVGGLVRWQQGPPPDPVPIAVMQVAHVALPLPTEEPRSDPPAARPDSPAPPVRPALPPKRSVAASRPRAAMPSPAPTVQGETVTQAPPAMASAEAPPADAASADSGVPVGEPARPTPSQREAETGFETLLRAAVQDAARFPAAARAMGRQGRVRVGFDFRDGEVSSVRIVQSAGFDSFDEAALGAVTRAAYPSPPDHLKGRTLHLIVWVEFLKKGD